MTEGELAAAVAGLLIAASIWIPILIMEKWRQAEIDRLRRQIEALDERLSARFDKRIDALNERLTERTDSTRLSS